MGTMGSQTGGGKPPMKVISGHLNEVPIHEVSVDSKKYLPVDEHIGSQYLSKPEVLRGTTQQLTHLVQDSSVVFKIDTSRNHHQVLAVLAPWQARIKAYFDDEIDHVYLKPADAATIYAFASTDAISESELEKINQNEDTRELVPYTALNPFSAPNGYIVLDLNQQSGRKTLVGLHKSSKDALKQLGENSTYLVKKASAFIKEYKFYNANNQTTDRVHTFLTENDVPPLRITTDPTGGQLSSQK